MTNHNEPDILRANKQRILMADNDGSSPCDHGPGGEMRPAPAINNQRQWAVSQESPGQDNYFENQATKTNVANLASAGEIHFVLNYSED